MHSARRKAFRFVQAALQHSAHSVLSQGLLTLAQAVDCPSAAMREQVRLVVLLALLVLHIRAFARHMGLHLLTLPHSRSL